MKVGDLVTLSAYGKQRSYNLGLISVSNGYPVGLVIKVRQNSSYPYTVRWNRKVPHTTQIPNHRRSELKHAKGKQ